MLETLVRPPLLVPLEGAAPTEEWNTDEGISERMKNSKFEPIAGERGGRCAEFQIHNGQDMYIRLRGESYISSLIVCIIVFIGYTFLELVLENNLNTLTAVRICHIVNVLKFITEIINIYAYKSTYLLYLVLEVQKNVIIS